MLLVLHGARKNVGDFLIRQRGLDLIRAARPAQEIVLHERWRPLDRDVVDRADALVLCGGPGLAPNFYPGVFPLLPDVDDLDVPVLPLALGWSGQPMGDPDSFGFDDPSAAALRALHSRIGWSSVRDDLTEQLVRRADVGEARRTGCVVWYHLPSLGRPFAAPARVRRVVFTTPANVRGRLRESVAMMRLLARRYPGAQRACVFHRGLRPGDATSWEESAASFVLASVARSLGFRVVDAARDLSAIAFYGECDLHVGYRVHAHLDFLSRRRASLLVCEDGRGLGQAVTLHDPHRIVAGRPDTIARVDAALGHEEAAGWPATAAAVDEIERSLPLMRATLEQLPA